MDIKLLDIEPIKTNKGKIDSNPMMDSNIIPKHPCSIIFQGKSGSGKSVLLANLILKPQFYGDYFDKMFLFAGSPDDIFDELSIPDQNIFTNVNRWEHELKRICDAQEKIIDKVGIHRAPKVLIIFEDVISEQKFLRRSQYFLKAFIANRHYGISTFITTQSWTKVPRAVRLQAHCVYFFRGSQSETKLLGEEFTPSTLTEREFRRDIVGDATRTRFSFLTIMTRLPDPERFRKKLGEIYNIE